MTTMCPGFDSWHDYHIWVEFVVGSSPCSERLLLAYSSFPPLSKNQHSNPNSIRNLRATGLSVVTACYMSLLLSKVN